MSKTRAIFALLVFATGILSTAAPSEPSDHALLVGAVRTLNTAEGAEFSKYGSYANWQTLLSHQTDFLSGWLAKYRPSEPHFAAPPGILSGWNLRLSVHPDGRGYDLLLEDANDKTGYAALSDERGAIRECKWLE